MAKINYTDISRYINNENRIGEANEYTKMYLANKYRLENCGDFFYGDFIKDNNKTK